MELEYLNDLLKKCDTIEGCAGLVARYEEEIAANRRLIDSKIHNIGMCMIGIRTAQMQMGQLREKVAA